MTTKKEKTDAKREAIATLQIIVPKNKEVYTLVTHVAQSGMSRWIRCFIVDNGTIRDISWLVCGATENRGGDKGVYMSGCGMDMTYKLVSDLSYALGYNSRTPEAGSNCYGLNHTHI